MGTGPPPVRRLTGDKIDAQEAWRLGLVNRVVPRSSLSSAAKEMADKVALVPPIARLHRVLE